ncbi:MFS transporter [Gordonia sp. FQ]|uniref:MFS transporter n=1 Tax=Gordonia sp. FQ TaxID=3446634 RepID=UPI003F85C3AE
MTAPTATRGPRLRPYQLASLLLCMVLNMLDGYDIFIMAFAGPHLPDGFASDRMLGWLISAALAGQAVGALGMARFADIIGRRRLLLIALTLNTAGLVASALSVNAWMLMGCRFVTGIAVGMITVVAVVLGQELAPKNGRSLAVGLVVVGYPLGSTVAGLSAAALLELVGGAWQGMFWVGTGLSVLIALIAFALLPESVAFLHRRGTPESRQQAADLARRLGLEDLGGDAPESVTAHDTLPRSRLLGRDLWLRTVLLCTGYSLLTAGYYFVGTWTPKLVTKVSDEAAGTAAGLCISIGTLVGAFVFGILGMCFRASAFAVVSAIVGAVTVAIFAFVPGSGVAYALAVLLGIAVFGCITAFTAASTFLYPIDARASSYGTMNGVGRLGAVLGPIIAGYAVNVLSVKGTYLIAAILLAGAAVAAIAIDRTVRAGTEEAAVV